MSRETPLISSIWSGTLFWNSEALRLLPKGKPNRLEANHLLPNQSSLTQKNGSILVQINFYHYIFRKIYFQFDIRKNWIFVGHCNLLTRTRRGEGLSSANWCWKPQYHPYPYKLLIKYAYMLYGLGEFLLKSLKAIIVCCYLYEFFHLHISDVKFSTVGKYWWGTFKSFLECCSICLPAWGLNVMILTLLFFFTWN